MVEDLRTLTEYQLRSEEMSLRKLRRQAQVALRCGRRLELDLGHQRERASREAAKQPTELAGPEMEEDPQLCIEDMLANPMEGLPPDFSDSLALVCQLDAQVSSCAERLFDLAPEPCFRHRWDAGARGGGDKEEACCKLMAKEWQDHVAQAAASSPGISSSIGIRGLSNEARGSNVFWGDQAEDPNWLLLQAEQVILKWQSEDSEGAPGPCRLKDPELAWAPFNEAVLRLSCRLLDQAHEGMSRMAEVEMTDCGAGLDVEEPESQESQESQDVRLLEPLDTSFQCDPSEGLKCLILNLIVVALALVAFGSTRAYFKVCSVPIPNGCPLECKEGHVDVRPPIGISILIFLAGLSLSDGDGRWWPALDWWWMRVATLAAVDLLLLPLAKKNISLALHVLLCLAGNLILTSLVRQVCFPKSPSAQEDACCGMPRVLLAHIEVHTIFLDLSRPLSRCVVVFVGQSLLACFLYLGLFQNCDQGQGPAPYKSTSVCAAFVVQLLSFAQVGKNFVFEDSLWHSVIRSRPSSNTDWMTVTAGNSGLPLQNCISD
eukprot:s18_g46.t1